jgi:hypothetical protein
MATTALSVMLPEFGRYIGSFVGNYTVTTAINADNLVLSTALVAEGYDQNDDLDGFWIKITSFANLDVVRHIGDYTGSSGTITVDGPVLADDSANLATFEVYRWNPNKMVDALNDGRQRAFPALHRRITDKTLTSQAGQQEFARPTSIMRNHISEVRTLPTIKAKTFANNIINDLNCDMESTTVLSEVETPDNWVAVNATLTAENDTSDPDNFAVFRDQKSMKVLVGASSVNTALVTVTDGTSYNGQELNIGMWVYSKTASRVSVGISVDSGTITTGSTHTGSGWERLTHSVVEDAIDTTLKVGLHVTSGTAFVFYADEIIVTAGYSEAPELVGNLVLKWSERGDNLVTHAVLPEFQNIILQGRGQLSSVSSGTDTMELDGYNLPLMYSYCGKVFFTGDQHTVNQGNFNEVERRLSRFQDEINSGVGAMASQSTRRTSA